MDRGRFGALLNPPGIAMAIEGDREPRTSFLRTETALES